MMKMASTKALLLRFIGGLNISESSLPFRDLTPGLHAIGSPEATRDTPVLDTYLYPIDFEDLKRLECRILPDGATSNRGSSENLMYLKG
jgi:hypothetical protein